MAFDVLRGIEDTETPYPTYNFYSSVKDSYVTVTTQEDGDDTSEFATIAAAVRFYNNLGFDPDVEVRDDMSSSPTAKTYAFDLKNATVVNTGLYTTLEADKDANSVGSRLRQLRNIAESVQDAGQTSREDFNRITSLLRSLSVTQIIELDDLVQPATKVTDFLTVENLSTMDIQDVNDLVEEVPELADFIDFSNIAVVDQTQINAAINGIPDLNKKLGLAMTSDVPADIPMGLGTTILGLPGFKDYFGETDENGREIFPDGAESSDVASTNFNYFEPAVVGNQPNTQRINELIAEGRATFNPMQGQLESITALIGAANRELQNLLGQPDSYGIQGVLNSLNGYVDAGTGKKIPGLQEIIVSFTKHTDNLTNVLPPLPTPMPLDPNISGDDLDALLDDPLVGLTGSADEIVGQNAIGAVESMSSLINNLATSIDGDWDGLDELSGYKGSASDTIMGSVLAPVYPVYLQELIVVLTELINFNTNSVVMERALRDLTVRAIAVQTETKISASANVDAAAHARLVATAEALDQAIAYFGERISGAIPQRAITDAQRITQLTYIGAWAGPVLEYYRVLLSNTIIGEINGYRSSFVDAKKTNFIDKSKSGATLLNTLATPELNEAIKNKQNTDDNVIRTTIPIKRVDTTGYPEGFALAQFVDSDVDKNARRLKNYERDFKGEINSFSNTQLNANLQAIATFVLAPLKSVGFDFDIIRGLRPLEYNRSQANQQNNSDHFYGLAVDIRLKDPSLTGLAAAYIRARLPWNKLIVFNFNQGSKANANAYIHISHYSETSHGWEKNKTTNPTGDGMRRRIGGNGIPIPGFDN